MPNPKVCNRIADPAARRRCLNYEGEFAQPAGLGLVGDQGQPPKPKPIINPRQPMSNRRGGLGGGRRRRGGGGWGQY